jgi:hypothetical protein
MTRTFAHVLEMNVKFNFQDETGNIVSYVTSHFRSWRTTGLFLKPSSHTVDLVVFLQSNHMRSLRERVARIVDFINQNGGWTLIGWYRRGEVHDASGGVEQGEQIAGVNQPIHLSYVYPSEATVIPQIQNMRFDPSTPTVTMADNSQVGAEGGNAPPHAARDEADASDRATSRRARDTQRAYYQ